MPFKPNALVPTKLIPVAGELITGPVGGVIDHVREVTAQLSVLTGFGVTTVATQAPTSVFCIIFVGHVNAGAWLS